MKGFIEIDTHSPSPILLNIKEIQQVKVHDGKTNIILANSEIIITTLLYSEVKQRIELAQ